jgi:hypothetical protein
VLPIQLPSSDVRFHRDSDLPVEGGRRMAKNDCAGFGGQSVMLLRKRSNRCSAKKALWIELPSIYCLMGFEPKVVLAWSVWENHVIRLVSSGYD